MPIVDCEYHIRNISKNNQLRKKKYENRIYNKLFGEQNETGMVKWKKLKGSWLIKQAVEFYFHTPYIGLWNRPILADFSIDRLFNTALEAS